MLLLMGHVLLFTLMKWVNYIHTGLITIVLFIEQCEANQSGSESFSARGSLNWLKAGQVYVLVGDSLRVYTAIDVHHKSLL